MTAFLQASIDKFTFLVATDRLYNSEGVWAKQEGNYVRIGLSDFLRVELQRRRGLEVMPQGSQVQFGEELAVIETVKAYISLSSPVNGKVVEVNPALAVITKDPYGAGWLAVLEATNWEADRACLLNAQDYTALVKAQAKERKDHDGIS